MYGLQDAVLLRVGNCPLTLGIAAPQEIDHPALTLGNLAHHGIGKLFPPPAGMRGRLVFAHREDRIEEQHSLLGPAIEIARSGDRRTDVGGYLLKDILQRGGMWHSVSHREAETMRLSRTVVGVLTNDNHLQLIERTFIEGTKDVATARIDAARGILLLHKTYQLLEVGFRKLLLEQGLPIGRNSHIHRQNVFVKIQKSGTTFTLFY